MNFLGNFKKNNQKTCNRGFTLIEMMVSISLFSIVLIVMMGSIITVIDVNRKSQTLANVMNDVNFALESINRTIVTGELKTGNTGSVTSESIESIDQNDNNVKYSLGDDGGRGFILRTIGTGASAESVALTSKEVDIKTLDFQVFDNDDNKQPRVLVLIEGEAKSAKEITSSFRIQTSIGQRNLDSQDLYP